MDKAPNEAFRVRAQASCNQCHREVKGWIAFNNHAQIVNCEGFMVFEDGLTCDACLGMIPRFRSFRRV